jgi:hypothetical protein
MNQRQRLRSWARPYWLAVKAWLINYGFAALVLIALVGGIVVAQQTHVPETSDLPGLAFGSQLLYRNEIGGISFIFYYLIVLVFVLALNGRGFTEIGPKGVRDGKVVNKETQETIKGQEQSIEALTRDLKKSTEATRMLSEEVAMLRKRLDDLEK